MHYSSGNYEAFARPRKPEGVENRTAWFVGRENQGIVPLGPKSHQNSPRNEARPTKVQHRFTDIDSILRRECGI